MNFINDPKLIEEESMKIIDETIKKYDIEPKNLNVLKRVIHTTADFDYIENLLFSNNVMDHAIEILKKGATIVTDTRMAYSGINKKSLELINCKVDCFIDHEDVFVKAKKLGVTRSQMAVEHAMEAIEGPIIFAVGNAPTALIKLYDLVKKGELKPDLIIGVPVGFVNVVESKELITELDIPYIVGKGRKGGSNVAAAICNALIYQIARA